MLNKLRSRHPVDVPAEGWQRSRGLLAVIGTLGVLVVVVPVLLAILEGALRGPLMIGIAVAAALAALLILGALGAKPGYRVLGKGGR